MADVTLSSILSSGFPYKKQQIFTASQLWTFPSTAMPTVDYDIIGGGGAGCGTDHVTYNMRPIGGGGGGRKRGSMTLVPGSVYSAIVGAGGVGAVAASSSSVAQAGGNSSFNGVVAQGGRGGGMQNTVPTVGVSGDGMYPANAANTPYQATSAGGGLDTGPGNSGIDGICSGGGSGSSAASAMNLGGVGAGDGSYNADAGSATTVGGGGGSAGVSTAAAFKGGSGYRGEIRITYWDSVP